MLAVQVVTETFAILPKRGAGDRRPRSGCGGGCQLRRRPGRGVAGGHLRRRPRRPAAGRDTAYAINGAVGAERSVSKSFRQEPLFLGLFTAQVFLGAAVALILGNPIRRLVQARSSTG